MQIFMRFCVNCREVLELHHNEINEINETDEMEMLQRRVFWVSSHVVLRH